MVVGTLLLYLSTLLAILGVPLAEAVLDFTGPGVVSCPVSDYRTTLCLPSFLNGNPQSCFDGGYSCNLDAALPTLTSSSVIIPIPCDCLVARGCADSCTFAASTDDAPLALDAVETVPTSGPASALPPSTSLPPSDNPASLTPPPSILLETAPPAPIPSEPSTTTPVTSSGGLDFLGPGLVTCPSADYFAAPCFANFVDCVDAESCGTIAVPETEPEATSFYLPLPCSCFSATNCPATCTFESQTAVIDTNVTTATPNPSPSIVEANVTASPTPGDFSIPLPTLAPLNTAAPNATVVPTVVGTAPTDATPTPRSNSTVAPSSIPAVPTARSTTPSPTRTTSGHGPTSLSVGAIALFLLALY